MGLSRVNDTRYGPFDVLVAMAAAAMAAASGTRPVDVEALRAHLRDAGALLLPVPDPVHR